MKNTYQQLLEIFREAKNTHAQAFAAANGQDPEWPLWYADFLMKPLGEVLSASFTKSELVYLLVLADKEQMLRAPGADWAGYYARFFAERFT